MCGILNTETLKQELLLLPAVKTSWSRTVSSTCLQSLNNIPTPLWCSYKSQPARASVIKTAFTLGRSTHILNSYRQELGSFNFPRSHALTVDPELMWSFWMFDKYLVWLQGEKFSGVIPSEVAEIILFRLQPWLWLSALIDWQPNSNVFIDWEGSLKIRLWTDDKTSISSQTSSQSRNERAVHSKSQTSTLQQCVSTHTL